MTLPRLMEMLMKLTLITMVCSAVFAPLAAQEANPPSVRTVIALGLRVDSSVVALRRAAASADPRDRYYLIELDAAAREASMAYTAGAQLWAVRQLVPSPHRDSVTAAINSFISAWGQQIDARLRSIDQVLTALRTPEAHRLANQLRADIISARSRLDSLASSEH